MGTRLSESEIKDVLIQLLVSIHNYCEQENLSYFLSYGSLIGAIRHKGFIPWDDDIDICMPRKDYETLIKHYNEKQTGTTVLISPENDPDYYVTSAKLLDTRTVMKEHVSVDKTIGVYLDIFPIDYWPDDREHAIKQNKKITFLRKMLTLKNLQIDPKRGCIKNLIVMLGHIALIGIGRRKLINKIISVSTMYNENRTPKYAGVVSESDHYGIREIMPVEWMQRITKATFEGKEYKIPAYYDSILSQLYGDYMSFPPKTEQISHHGYDVWWKD